MNKLTHISLTIYYNAFVAKIQKLFRQYLFTWQYVLFINLAIYLKLKLLLLKNLSYNICLLKQIFFYISTFPKTNLKKNQNAEYAEYAEYA